MKELKKELRYWENYRIEILRSGIPKILKDEHLSEVEYNIVKVLSNIDDYKKQRRPKVLIAGAISLVIITITLLLLFI
jgi:hypothetical protein